MSSVSLRTTHTQRNYDEKIKLLGAKDYHAFIFDSEDREVLEEYRYWFITPNDFPYDRIALSHDLLIPKRIFSNLEEAKEDEYVELLEVKKEISGDYDLCVETLGDNRSINRHFHYHLLELRPRVWGD